MATINKPTGKNSSIKMRAISVAAMPALPRPAWYHPWKVAIEFTMALVMLLLAAPVMLLAALIVKLTSPGPAFYSQTRLGRFGRTYTIFKLRSMRHNCEKQSGPCWSSSGDSRVTPFGRFLRRSHIDELPQLWNVLRGDMSLVGPRPERPEFLPKLEEAVPLYRCRLLVKPGVTGLAQVQLPADTDMNSVRRKIAYDLFYVQHSNPWLDFRLFFATVLHVFCVPDKRIAKMLFLPRGEPVENAYARLVDERRHAPAKKLKHGSDDMINVEMVPV
jgi:lipopolysaccharide/colanic/teichoic acid biosynthesis glycosyltransferase